ncbi:hypothetical protein ACTFIZ_005663 [Dictyostelium cf. discoideum]
MKMIKLLLLLLIFVLNKNQVKSVTYLEMTPYEKSDCSGESEGIGYAFIVNQCFAIAGDYYSVSLNSDHSNGTISEYKDGENNQCTGLISDNDKVYEIDGCYNAPNYVWNNGAVPSNYVKISISINPTDIPQYGFRQTTYAPGDKDCQSNPQFYWYSTNNTKIDMGTSSATFYCTDNESFEIYCDPGCFTTDSGMACVRDFTHWETENYVAGSC